MRKALLWIGQAALFGVVAWYFWHALGPALQQFSTVQLNVAVEPGWIALAALTVLATYSVLIEAWRRVLVGWGQKLGYAQATRIWCLSNLARFIPGRVWSIAGMAMLAQAAGVQGWAAAGSAVVIQALAIGTGVVVAAGLAPDAQTPLGLTISVSLAAAALVPFVWPKLGERMIRLIRPTAEWRPVAGTALLSGGLTTLASWLTYGGALWLLARGLFPGTTLSLGVAVGGFAAAYVLGLVAIFTPGGLIVREMVLSGVLAPSLGPEQALVLALASRILVTLTEGGAGLAVLLIRPVTQGERSEAK
jgi:hypothetical protein